MAVEAGGIGARLRTGREKLGLTVLQVAERIHTDPRIVDAIEAENYEALGAPVYARGHIRHYADLVGESANELVQIYSNLAKVGQPDLTRIVKAPAGPDSSKLVAPALVVVGVFAVAGAIWWISALSKKKPQMSETHVVTDGAPEGNSAPPSDASGAPDGAPASGVTAGAPPTAAAGAEAPSVGPGTTPRGSSANAGSSSGERNSPAGAMSMQPRPGVTPSGATSTQPRAGTTATQSRAGAASAVGSNGATGTSPSAARSNTGAGGSATGAPSAARAPTAGQTSRGAPPSTAPTSSASPTRVTPSATSASATTPTRGIPSAGSASATPSTRATSSATSASTTTPTRAGSSASPAPAMASTHTASAAPATPAAATPEAPAAPRPKNQSSVTLRYSADSWTEVYDASGARLFYDVGAANSVRTVVGTPPLRVVLGNASGVSVEYNGHSKPIAKMSRSDGSVQFSITRSGEVVRAKPVADGG
jgi:cytoskeletal protein RodZ